MKRIIVIFLVILSSCGWAQNIATRQNIRQGNRNYKKDKIEDSETAYRKALSQDSTYYKAQYNLGNALYKKKNYQEAANHFAKAIDSPQLSKKQRAQVHHNKGNCHLKAGLEDRQTGMQQFQQAIKEYQEALKIDSKNNETRENLSYAKKLLQQAQQQQQNGQGQDNNDQNQDDKDQQNQQNRQNNQDNQDKQNQQNQQQNQQNQKNQDKQDQQQQKPQPKDTKKEDAERLLEAVRNNEKNTMKDHQKQIKVGQVGRIEKDW